MLDGFGFDADVELTLRRDIVKIHLEGTCRAVFRRDLLREWLTYPEGSLTSDDVSFVLSTHGILLQINPSVPGHPLSEATLETLRSRV